ncbi:MAG TPA: hypothetical protein ACHBX0_05875 [Arsenophonus sp.]
MQIASSFNGIALALPDFALSAVITAIFLFKSTLAYIKDKISPFLVPVNNAID